MRRVYFLKSFIGIGILRKKKCREAIFTEEAKSLPAISLCGYWFLSRKFRRLLNPDTESEKIKIVWWKIIRQKIPRSTMARDSKLWWILDFHWKSLILCLISDFEASMMNILWSGNFSAEIVLGCGGVCI